MFQNPIDKDKPFVLAPHLAKINAVFNQATVEDICKQLESDQSEWAQHQLKTLKKMVSFLLRTVSIVEIQFTNQAFFSPMLYIGNAL